MKVKPNLVQLVYRCPSCRREVYLPIGKYPANLCEVCMGEGKGAKLKDVTMELEGVYIDNRGFSVEEVFQVFEDFLNNFGCPNKSFIEKLVHGTHRTLQQSAMRLFIGAIQEWAKQENFDDRNAQTIKLAKKIVKSCEDDLHLPCI